MKNATVPKKEFLLAICSAFICLLACDLVLKSTRPPVYRTIKYGWSMPEKILRQTLVEDQPGKFRRANAEYFEYGFKRWGDVRTQKTKMLIIGDSFTDINCVSNGEEWYSYLERKFKNLELFVFGGGGYGTLQEFMILDDFIDIIKPQIILIQFSPNDFWNNLYALDIKFYPYNNHAYRPYWESGKIVYRLPMPFSTLRRYSFMADRILARYDRFARDRAVKNLRAYAGQKDSKTLHASEGEKAETRKLEKEAFAVTNEIYGMIRRRAGETIPIYLFNIQDTPYAEDICKTNRITCIPGIEGEFDAKEKEGFPVKVVNDGHWNRLGNELVGQKLVEYFEKEGLK
jgi:hypothetical protein